MTLCHVDTPPCNFWLINVIKRAMYYSIKSYGESIYPILGNIWKVMFSFFFKLENFLTKSGNVWNDIFLT